MATREDYAALAFEVYNDVRSEGNQVALAAGWSPFDKYVSPGFSASAYQKDNQIVISFKGTDVSGISNLVSDWYTNFTAGTGLTAFTSQIYQAAEFAARIIGQNPGADVIFTGHSLGGGLASLMSVWFDKSATTFDEAPFAATADNPLAPGLVWTYLKILGLQDPKFDLYVHSPTLTYPERKGNVTHYYLEGEALSYLRDGLQAAIGMPAHIVGTEFPVKIGDHAGVDPLGLHSMAVLGALLSEEKLADLTFKLSSLLPLLYDSTFYATGPKAPKTDLITRLYNNQILSIGGDPLQRPSLTRLSGDLERIVKTGIIGNDVISSALIATALEHYYLMGDSFTKELFSEVAGGLKFDLRDIDLDGANSLALPRLINASRDLLSSYGDSTYLWNLRFKDQWYLQAGDAGMTAVSETDGEDIMIGGSGNDNLDGGGEDDDLYGGDGEDTLKGGYGGNDNMSSGNGAAYMDGGSGNDSYLLDVSDTINREDSSGIIKDKQGNVINGFFIKTGDDQYAWANNAAVSATKDAMTLTLVGISVDEVLSGGAVSDSLFGDASELFGGDGDDEISLGLASFLVRCRGSDCQMKPNQPRSQMNGK